MNSISTLLFGSLAFAAIAASPARAETASGVFAFERPVSDELLGTARGGAAFASLTIGRLALMTDVNARSDLRFLGSSGQYQMDIWWSTVGSELIAENVRAIRSQ